MTAKRRRAITIGVCILAVLAALIVLSLPYGSARVAQPLRLHVNASKLPATASVFGSRITLDRILPRANGESDIALTIHYPSGRRRVPVVPERGMDILVDGRPCGRLLLNEAVDVPRSNYSYCCATVKLPSGVHRLVVSQSLRREPAYNWVEVQFRRIRPTALPVTRSKDGAEVKLARAYVGGLTGNWTRTDPPFCARPTGKHFLVLETLIHKPVDTRFTARVEIGRRSGGSSFNGAGESVDPEGRAFVKGPGGRWIRIVAYRWDMISSSWGVVTGVANAPTLLERAVTYVSPGAASRLATRRATNAVRDAGMDIRGCYAFPWTGPLPKRIDFSTSVKLPPRPEDTGVVRFQGIILSCP